MDLFRSSLIFPVRFGCQRAAACWLREHSRSLIPVSVTGSLEWCFSLIRASLGFARRSCQTAALNSVAEARVIVLFGAEGVVTAAGSRHVQASCRAAGITLLRKICVGCVDCM